MITSGASRYPGARSFQDSDLDRTLFRGRQIEAQRLLHQVLSEDMVVLYGKSGMGKSSLINAGVMQSLRVAGYVPVIVRLNDPTRGCLEAVYESIRFTAKSQGLELVEGNAATLASYVATSELWAGDRLMIPLLVFDQFEELFTLQVERERKSFIEELAGIVRGLPPTASSSDGRRTQVKVLLSLREDYLARLEQLATSIPHILSSRFALGPLRRDQAVSAIEQPATVTNAELKTPPFAFAPGTVARIVDFLCTHHGSAETLAEEVEPFQLQIVCQRVETLVREWTAQGQQPPIVEYEMLGGDRGLQNVLRSFYEDQLEHLGSSRIIRSVRRLCEEGLISAHRRRLSLEADDIASRFQVEADTLTKLVQRRLLRAEPRMGSTYYELSHDTLVQPILETRKRRERVRRQRYLVAGAAAALLLITAGVLVREYTEESEAIRNEAAALAKLQEDSEGTGRLRALALLDRGLASGNQQLPSVIHAASHAISKSRFAQIGTVPAGAGVFALAPRGDLVATAEPNGSVTISDVHGYLLRQIDNSGSAVRHLAFGRVTYRVAALLTDGRVRVWSLDGKTVWESQERHAGAEVVEFSPDERFLAVGLKTGVVLLDAKTGLVVERAAAEDTAAARWHRPDGGPRFLSFSADGGRLTGSQASGVIRLWTITSEGRLTSTRTFRAISGTVTWALSSDRRRVAAVSQRRVFIQSIPASTRNAAPTVPASATSEVILETTSQPGSIPSSADTVTHLAMNASGQTIVAARADGRVVIVEGSRRPRTINVHPSARLSAVSVDGTGRLFATSSDRVVKVWSIEGGEVARLNITSEESTDVLTEAILFHPSKPLLLTGSTDGAVRFWRVPARPEGAANAQSGGSILLEPIHVIRRPHQPRGYVLSLALNLPGDLLALGDDEGRIEAWHLSETNTGGVESNHVGSHVLPNSEDVRNLMFHPSDHRTFAAACDEGRAFTVRVAEHLVTASEIKQTDEVTPAFVGYSESGDLLVGRSDGTFEVRGPRSPKATIDIVTAGSALALPLEGRDLLVVDDSGRWRVLSEDSIATDVDAVRQRFPRRVPPPSEVRRHNLLDADRGSYWPVGGIASTLRPAPASKIIAAGHVDGSITILSSSGERIAEGTPSEKSPIVDVQFTPDESAVIAITRDGSIFSLTNVPSSAERRLDRTTVISRDSLNEMGNRRLSDSRYGVDIVLTGGSLRAHDTQSGEVVFERRRLSVNGATACDGIEAAVFVGHSLLAGCRTGKIVRLTPAGDLLPAVYATNPQRAISSLAASELRAVIAAGTYSGDESDREEESDDRAKGDLFLFRLDGQLVHHWPAVHDGRVFALAISPDGRLLASAGGDTIAIRSLEDPTQPVRLLSGHSEGEINDLAFSTDGRRLVSASDDRTVRIWDTQTGQETKAMLHPDAVGAAAFHGTGVLTLSEDGFRLWDLAGSERPPAVQHFNDPDPGGLNLLASGCLGLRGSPLLLDPSTEERRRARAACDRVWSADFGLPLPHAAVMLGVHPDPQSPETTSLFDRHVLDSRGRSPLHIAAAAGDVGLVGHLLKAKAYVDTGDSDGRTPLVEAVQAGQLATALTLLVSGANPNVVDWVGNSPLHVAALNGDHSMVSALLDGGAETGWPNKLGVTPLMNAASRGFSAIVEELIRRGAVVDAVDMVGSTALIDAARGGHQATVKALVESGADINHVTKSRNRRTRMTAMLWARRLEREDLIQILAAKRPLVTVRFPDIDVRFSLRNSPAEHWDAAERVRRMQDGGGWDQEREEFVATFRRRAEAASDPFVRFLLAIATGRVLDDHTSAARAYTAAAEAGDAAAMAAVGMAYWSADFDGRQDLGKAAEYLTRSASAQSPAGLLFLSVYKEQVMNNRKEAADLQAQAAATGDPVALNSHAVRLRGDRGGPRDMISAVAAFQKASAQQDVYARSNLAALYAAGDGVERSTSKAVELWKGAASDGGTTGALALADLYFAGSLLRQSDADAIAWYTHAAKMDVPAAQTALAYLKGPIATTPDEKLSVLKLLYHASAQLDDVAAGKLRASGLKP